MYIDAQLNIRGVEAIISEDETNILSKEVSKAMVNQLTKVIIEMQEDHDLLAKKFDELEKKYKILLKEKK